MPMKPKRPCNYINCNELVTSGYCDKHKQVDQQMYDSRRGSNTERGYGATHRKIREVVKREEPLCRECLKTGKITPSNEMDHIDGNAWNTSRDNLEMLCSSCHSRKTIREQGGYGNKKNV